MYEFVSLHILSIFFFFLVNYHILRTSKFFTETGTDKVLIPAKEIKNTEKRTKDTNILKYFKTYYLLFYSFFINNNIFIK